MERDLLRQIVDHQIANGERCPKCRAHWLFCNCRCRHCNHPDHRAIAGSEDQP